MTQTKTANHAPAPLGLIGSVLLIVIVSFTVSVSKNGYVGYETNTQNMLARAKQNLQRYLAADAEQNSGLCQASMRLAARLLEKIESRYQQIPAINHTPNVGISLPAPNGIVKQISSRIKMFALYVWVSGLQVWVKGLSFFESGWAFIAAVWLGVMDGLLLRFVRTAEGGRESTWAYHRIARPLLWSAVLLAAMYLCWPSYVSFRTVCLPMAGLLFFYSKVRTACLKKYI